jgi:hypothetical protein
MTRFVAILLLLVACNKKSTESSQAGSGSAPTPVAAGDAAAAPAIDAPVAVVAPDAAVAVASACKPDAFSNDNPPFCLDIAANYKADMKVSHEDGKAFIFRNEGDDSISVSLDKKATDLEKAGKNAKAIAKAGASSKEPLEMTDVDDGKLITYTLCEAEIGCGPAMILVKKTSLGMFTCESSSQTNDKKWVEICKSFTAK